MMCKIAILIGRLNGGGAERSAGNLSTLLTNLGYNVSVITLDDDVQYAYQGTLFNLGIHAKDKHSFLMKFRKYLKLKKVLKQNNFDVVLDFRLKDFLLKEILLNIFVFNSKMVNMVRSFKIDWYLSNPKYISKLLYQNYSGINTVSLKIKHQIESEFGFNNVTAIYSSIDVNNTLYKSSNDASLINQDFIVAIGRLDANKQFDKLIEAYAKSVLPENNVSLFIIGKSPEHGSIKDELLGKIDDLKLQNKIKILPFQKDPFKYIKQSRFLILSSMNEGLPRVVLESIACETPVVAFDCNSGPSEIIIDRKNGLLVENQDFKKLTLAMNEFQTNSELYDFCKKNCKNTLEKFSLQTVSNQWKDYIETLI
jgi:N-acetylgalactosamine-N,N'-diacetylbacillosaminyl-diphospho-undecaprenol 4-alpha-N-acetylgalactosaminyltransferase